VTHYHLAGRPPFLTLSELGDSELAAVLAELRGLHQAGKQHRPFGPRYMDLRRRTEARLRELFVAAGGKPERRAPHYFVLGDSPWYEGLAEKMERVQLPLSALQPDQASFTYPDSFAAMGLGARFGLGQQARPYHGRVFLLDDLPGLIEQFGIPAPSCDGGYQTWTTWPDEAYIEVQLWSDEPVGAYLGPLAPGRQAGSKRTIGGMRGLWNAPHLGSDADSWRRHTRACHASRRQEAG
jgi:hypothetical protein